MKKWRGEIHTINTWNIHYSAFTLFYQWQESLHHADLTQAIDIKMLLKHRHRTQFNISKLKYPSVVHQTPQACKNKDLWYDMIWIFILWYDFICTKSQPKGRITMYNMRHEGGGEPQSMTRNKAKSTTIDNRETRPNWEAGEQRRK